MLYFCFSENEGVTVSSTTDPGVPLIRQRDESHTGMEDDPSATATYVFQQSNNSQRQDVNVAIFSKPKINLPESGQAVHLSPHNPKSRDEDYLTGGQLVEELRKESNSEVSFVTFLDEI